MQAWRACWFAGSALLWLACTHRPGEGPGALPAGMTRPRPESAIDWSYPPETTSPLAGTLSVRCVITEQGHAEECEVLKSNPQFDRWVIDKLEGTAFVPATFGGAPVPTSYVFTVRFDVPESERRWRPPLTPGEIDACRGRKAEGCMTTALGLLAPDGGTREVDRASRLLGAACAGGLAAACRRLDASFQAPRLLDDVSPPTASTFPGAEGDVVCWVSTAGQARGCRGPDSAPARWFIDRLTHARFAPATFEKEPFETEYLVRYSFRR